MKAAKALFSPSASTNAAHARGQLVSAWSSVLIAASRATEACLAIFLDRRMSSISSVPSHARNASRLAGDESNAQSASKTFSSHSSSASSAGSRDLNGAKQVSTASMPPSPPRSCFTASPPVCARIANTSAAYARMSSAPPPPPTLGLPFDALVARRAIHRGNAPPRAPASSAACSGSISSRFSTTPSAWCTAAASSGTSRSRLAKRSSAWSRSSYPLSRAKDLASAAPPSSCDSTASASVSSCRSSSACAATSALSCASSCRMEGTALRRTNSGYSSG